jgi:hypothetical protein
MNFISAEGDLSCEGIDDSNAKFKELHKEFHFAEDI